MIKRMYHAVGPANVSTQTVIFKRVNEKERKWWLQNSSPDKSYILLKPDQRDFIRFVRSTGIYFIKIYLLDDYICVTLAL